MIPLILNIDTSTNNASICLASGGESLEMLSNRNQQDHASWLHLAIISLLDRVGKTLKQLDAIAVTSGPGSYTGLRVGLASAKGFCYALSIPLIMESTLKMMAISAKEQGNFLEDIYLCPMIDARRMEVFTAIFSKELEEIVSPKAIILKEDLFREADLKKKLIFFGDGSAKFKILCPPSLGNFCNFETDATYLAKLSAERYRLGEFSDPLNAIPFYGKAFFTKPAN